MRKYYKKYVVSILALIGFMTSIPSYGADQTDQRKVFFAISSTYSSLGWRGISQIDTPNRSDGFTMRAGGFMTEHWGVELQFDRTGLFGYLFEFEPDYKYVLTADIHTFTGNLRYRFPHGRWEPSIYCGAGITHGRLPGNQDISAAVRYGSGIAYQVIGGLYMAFQVSGISVINRDEGFDIFGMGIGLEFLIGPKESTRSSN